MFRKGLAILFNDAGRGDDRAFDLAGQGKPPVLRRATLNLLGICLLVVICYGSLMPFMFKSEWVWTWRLPLHKPSPSDFVTNLILYLPIGIFLRLLYRRRGTRAFSEIALSLITITVVSYATELCQILLVDRVASLTDVISNVAGAAAGILLAPGAQRAMRNLHGWLYTAMRERPFGAAAALFSLVLFVGALTPFDPLPTPDHLASRLHAVIHAESLFPFGSGWGGDLAVSPQRAVDKVLAVVAYGVLAFLLVLGKRERGSRPGACATYAFTRAGALAAGIELVQLGTISHAFDPADLTGAWICAGAGTLAALGWIVTRAQLPFSRMTGIQVLVLAILAAALLGAILPSLTVAQPATAPLRIGLPMISNFHMSWNALLARYLEAFSRYALIVGAVVAWRRAQGHAPGAGLMLVTSMVALLSTLVLDWWSNRPFDSCHVILAGLAALLVARADTALFNRPPRPVTSPN